MKFHLLICMLKWVCRASYSSEGCEEMVCAWLQHQVVKAVYYTREHSDTDLQPEYSPELASIFY